MDSPIIIALDGPSGAGKSTLAKAVAKELDILYVDTGALYRTIGIYVKSQKVDPHDADAVTALLPEINIEMRHENGVQNVYLSGENVGDRIRTPEASMYASAVSAIPSVRSFLLDTQRRFAKTTSVIMDGRDIGTVIFPKADVKLFLTASLPARAKRRYKELTAKGQEVKYEDILADMELRDKNDSTRALAPLKPAEDAILFDNSKLSLEKTVDKALKLIRKKLRKNEKRRNRRGTPLYCFLHFLLAPPIRLLFRIHVHGKENIPQTGGAVLCSNHIAIRDVFVVAASIKRQTRFLGKKELFKIPVLRRVIRALGATPVTRDGRDVGAVKTMIAIAKEENGLVTIFPQGTRREGVNPADTPVKNGAGMIACRAHVPMIPLCIKTEGVKYRFLRRIDVYIGKPISPEELGFDAENADYSKATEKVFREICALGGYQKTASDTEDDTQS